MKDKVIALFALMMFGCGAVLALGVEVKAKADSKQEWNQLDSNQDGLISVEEASEDMDLLQKFRLADKNRDGKLSRAEFSTATQASIDTEEAE